MSDIDTSSGGGHKDGKKRSKKQSTKVDMTPMVDLGFLLITFFMLTTTFSKPHRMDIQMPAKDKNDPAKATDTKASKTVTLFLESKDLIYWYPGLLKEKPVLSKTDFSAGGLRKLLLEKQTAIGKELVVIVKPTESSRFKNMVDIVDELRIAGIAFYSITDMNADEKAYLLTNKK